LASVAAATVAQSAFVRAAEIDSERRHYSQRASSATNWQSWPKDNCAVVLLGHDVDG
jgi:hypothetical protein